MSRLILVFIATLSLISSSAMGIAPTCDFVVLQLNPCLSYLMRTEATPHNSCCLGVNNLKGYSNDKTARRTICQCIEQAAPTYKGIDYSLISGLPQKCGVSVKLPAVSPSFDCSKA
ncbi:non-specific lipid-transfer protein 3-like [Pistacia vera]|uniref:non-specific lipid-transfer protein 3-like n=1 Tax=Pistacia vera TaxID=55513 RepID=UPI001263E557|nr:non-specific lipid-transfer protein 3-like [Pistacia vera]